MNPHDPKHSEALARLLGIMNDLREKCPWDRKQTLESIRHLTIEETYELSEAILAGDLEEVKKELGDLLLHIVFYTKIASESEAFELDQVIHGLCDKLVARHPHVYGDGDASDEHAVKQNWEKLKLQEKGRKEQGVLDGVPTALPGLLKALRIQEKVRGVGFDWPNQDAVWDKVEEELREFKEQCHVAERTAIDPEKAEEEFGDILFSLVNFARFVGINPETALEKTNRKFMRRFAFLEQAARRDGHAVPDLDLAALETYWRQAKQQEHDT